MPVVQFKYGNRSINTTLPDEVKILVPPILLEKSPSLEIALTEALNEAESTLEEYLDGAKDLLIVVPDRTRRCGLKNILPPILSRVEKSGLSDNRIRFLIATGTHIHIGREPYRELLGSDIVERFEVSEHDHLQGNVRVGTTSYGTPVEVNQMCLEADRVLAIGGMLPHYFAGFGGGPKLIIPGCAGLTTIEINHTMSLKLDRDWNPGCGPGKFSENRLIQDIIEAVSMLDPIYHIGIVLGKNEQPYRIFAGEINSTYRKMVDAGKELFTVEASEKADMVIVGTGGHPKDIDLLQSHKGMFHCEPILKKGGVMAALIECPAGIGSKGLEYLLKLGNLDNIRDYLSKQYMINGQAAISLMQMGRSYNVYIMTLLPDKLLNTLNFKRLYKVEDLLKPVEKSLAEGKKVYYLPYASMTICQ